MATFTKIIDRGYGKIIRELESAARKEVAVGLLAGEVNAEGASIADYAAYNEYGTDKIPSRPFMATSFDQNIDSISKDFNTQGAALIAGAVSADAALTIIGQKQAARIQNTITAGGFTKLSPRTIKAKKGSAKPLVDTAAMINAVQISIRPRGSK